MHVLIIGNRKLSILVDCKMYTWYPITLQIISNEVQLGDFGIATRHITFTTNYSALKII